MVRDNLRVNFSFLSAIQVPLAFYTIRPNDPNKTEVPYSSCSKLPIKVVVEDANFEYDSKTHYPNLKPACVVLPIKGNALGSSKVTASYSVGNKYFEDSVIVSTFKPLQVNVHFIFIVCMYFTDSYPNYFMNRQLNQKTAW